MSDNISEQLLKIIHSTLKEKKMNTASLAGQMGYERKDVKKILSGKTPLLVDDFANIARVLELEKDLLTTEPPTPVDSEHSSPDKLSMIGADDSAADEGIRPDPFGNHSAQMLRFGFALGVDILLMLDIEQLQHSNIPEYVMERFPSKFPVRLDALYHDKMKLRIHEHAFEILLSFDGLYDCVIPWSAVEHVVFFPIHDDEPDEASSEDQNTGPHLRLV